MTPAKPLSESVDDRNLAGGAADLSRAGRCISIIRRANSLPNLSMDIEDNCLFNKFPMWNVAHTKRAQRRQSSEIVDYSNWSNTDFSNKSNELDLQKPNVNSPSIGNANFKRILNISPSTPIGLPRKHLFQESSPNLREITHGEDVEMIDVEQQPVYGVISKTLLDERKHIKGRRRMNTFNREMDAPTTACADRVDTDSVVSVSGSQDEKSNTRTEPKDVNKLKGMSIKYLRQKGGKRQQLKCVGEKNYKVTRKKSKKSGVGTHEIDSSQRLIHSYYSRIVVGSKDEDKPQGSLED